MMAKCRKMTVAERIAQAEKEAGQTGLSAEARKAIELSLTPAPYVCTGSGVGLAGRKRRKRR